MALDVKPIVIGQRCRICSEVCVDLHSHISLFEELVVNDSLYGDYVVNDIGLRIMECAPIQIKYDDGFPNQICKNCLTSLNLAYEFRTLCINSTKLFERLHQEIPTEIYDDEHDENIVFDIISRHDDHNDKPIKKFKCETCKRRFKHEHALTQHKCYQKVPTKNKSYDKSQQFNFICEFCGKQFKQQNDLYKHKRTHTGERPYKCDVCQKGFSGSSILRRHKQIHTGERPFKCEYCSKSYQQNITLRVHLRSHTGEKPYKCLICDKNFKVKAQMLVHARVHTGETPYSCHICNKVFTQLGNYKSHLIKHEDQMPFKCDHCDKQFNLKTTLERHQRMHTGEKPYQCEACLKQFTVSSNLFRHQRKYCFKE